MDHLFRLSLDHSRAECEARGSKSHIYASLIQAFLRNPDLESVVRVAVTMTEIVGDIPPLREVAMGIPTNGARFELSTDDENTSVDVYGEPIDVNNLLVKALLAADQVKGIFKDALRLKGEYMKKLSNDGADANKKAIKEDLKGRKN